MSDENKPEDQGTAADAGATGDTSAPSADNVGTNDQSSEAASAAVEPGTPTTEPNAADSQPESTDAGVTLADVAAPPLNPAVSLEVAPTITTPPPVVTIATPPPEQPQIATPPPSIQSAPVVAVAPVVKESLVVVEAGGVTPYANINRVLAEVPKAKHAIIHFLMEYARDMAPRRPIPEQQGATYQVDLYRQLHSLINKEDEHFRPLFTAVLMFFTHEATRCFAASHAFRFSEITKLNADERASFNSLIDLLRLLGPVETRKENAKFVSLQKALAKNMTDTGRNRILSYFDGQL